MTIEDQRQRIMELWDGIEEERKIDLANIWEERRELGELEARVERLEPKVIKLLEVIPSLQRHSHEYHARTVDLIKLLHHVESSEGWYQRVRSDLEYINGEINKVKIVIRETSQKGGYTKIKYEYIEKLGYDIIKSIGHQGRLHPLAELSKLRQWLNNNYPAIHVEPIKKLDEELWLLIVLTADGKSGVAVPAIGMIIGTGEIMRWYEGGDYNGTQALLEKKILTLAKAEYDPHYKKWEPVKKGRIDLTYK